MLNFQSFSPAKNTLNVAVNTPVYFEIRNFGEDVVNTNTLTVKINAISAIINGVFQVGFFGNIVPNIRGCDVYIRQTTLFTSGTSVSVEIAVNSDVIQYSFMTAIADTLMPVTIASPRGGVFESQQSVSLLVDKVATTHYTTDGSTPILTSPTYSSPISITQNTTLKFFSIDNNNNQEYVHVEVYMIQSAPPHIAPITTANVPSGSYDTLTQVALISSQPATIYWTTDGSIPTITNFTGKDTSPVTVSIVEGQNVVKFFAVDPYENIEAVKTETYIVSHKENNIVPTNVFVTQPYIKNTVDICWDDMTPVSSDIVGYNVYRSQVDAQTLKDIISHDIITAGHSFSKRDVTFSKINTQPVTTTFYRDATLDRSIIKEDVSSQFRFKTVTDAATDFSGQIVNDLQWEALDPDRLFNQSDGLHFVDVFGGEKSSTFQSKFRMHGDFEIETEYWLNTWPVTSTIQFEEAAFVIAINQFTYVKFSRIRREAFDVIAGTVVIDSAQINYDEVPIEQFMGKIKIGRFGSNITLSYFDGAVWIILASYLDFSDKDVQVKFYAKSADQVIDVKFSYFHINNGQSQLPLMKDERGDYTIQVQHYPIVSRTTDHEYTDLPADVDVYIDDRLALVKIVKGGKGQVTLNTDRVYDNILKRWIEPPKPLPESVVTIVYQYRIRALKLNLGRIPFYKVTSLLSDGTETRLSWCESTTIESDKLDYTYREAIRRNSWLLDQAGERVLLFIRKTAGIRCECYLRNIETHKQAKIPCDDCYGTGYIGGYEGPYEIRIAPFQTDQKVMMTDRGMKFENIEETWTTVSPVLSQRDFILRRNGQIYAVGPIRTPDVKGVPTQQHFSVQSIDTTDIRYKFIVTLNLFLYGQKIGLRLPHAHYTQDPVIENGEVQQNDRLRTNKSPGYNNEKGRTVSFENTMF
jgi:Chitobiase/beta-hexosaminidase C-terminal domain